MNINIFKVCGNYAENKDHAREIRNNFLMPALKKKESIVFDFAEVDSSTQSFIHALISEAFQKHGERSLDLIEFQNCSKAVKSLVATVINYSME